MSTVEMTIEEMTESLNGYEEIGVEKHFGSDLNTILNTNATKGMRALVFTDLARDPDTTAAKAYDAAMLLPLSAVMDYFADDPEDMDAEEPDSESGKDGSAPA